MWMSKQCFRKRQVIKKKCTIQFLQKMNYKSDVKLGSQKNG